MKVDKVINNNLIRAYNEKKQEVLVMGRGIGFAKKHGDEIDTSVIEKVYKLDNPNATDKLITLLSEIPIEHVLASNEIIAYAKGVIGRKLNSNIYLALTDHINFAIERHKEGIHIKNALLWEIKHFYNHEYLIGKEALEMIKKRTGVALSEDEAGFIALHIVTAGLDSSDMTQTDEITKMIQQILKIVRYSFQMELDENSLHYERFVTHLKFFAKRIFNGQDYSNEMNVLYETVKKEYKKEVECAMKIGEYVKKEYNFTITSDEIVYLTIHIHRVTMKN